MWRSLQIQKGYIVPEFSIAAVADNDAEPDAQILLEVRPAFGPAYHVVLDTAAGENESFALT